MKKNKYVVLGGTGLVGYGVVRRLENSNAEIVCVSKRKRTDIVFSNKINYLVGDIYDKSFLKKIISDADIVFDFVSTSLPSDSNPYLYREIDTTLRHVDLILSTMVEMNAKCYVYPSSGGAVYGNCKKELAEEEDILLPVTPYGVGKKMAEDIIRYYHQKYNIDALIFRIGNVYGSPLSRTTNQCAIDIFIQQILDNKPLSVWQNAMNSTRDYILLDDVSDSVVRIAESRKTGVWVYNIGTGIGTNLSTVISLIEKYTNIEAMICQITGSVSAVNHIALSTQKVRKDFEWYKCVPLEEGIAITVERKKRLAILE